MLLIGYALHKIADLFTHRLRQCDTEVLLESVVYAALSGLRVDADDIGVIGTADILRIDGQVRNAPHIGLSVLTPLHSLCDGILM